MFTTRRRRYVDAHGSEARLPPSVPLVRKAAAYVTRILRVFGVAEGSDEIGLGDRQARMSRVRLSC